MEVYETYGSRFLVVPTDVEVSKDQGEKLSPVLCQQFGPIRADACIYVSPSECADADIRIVDYRGNCLPVCGNGTRCAAFYVHRQCGCEKNDLTLRLAGQMIPCTVQEWDENTASIAVGMGIPRLNPPDIPARLPSQAVIHRLHVGDTVVPVTVMSMGNPHAVIFVEDLDHAPVVSWGPQIEQHPLFSEGINVEFVQVVNRQHLRMRIWERGEGETVSCSTGACAAMVAACLRGFADSRGKVTTKGGDFSVNWQSDNREVLLTGRVARCDSLKPELLGKPQFCEVS